MDVSQSMEITVLLNAWSAGDREALERLAPRLSDELRRIARHYMRNEREGHTLQATALVNEVWLQLVDAAGIDWQNRGHFFAAAAQMMRRILVDSARARRSAKRGGPLPRVNLDDVAARVGSDQDRETVALDDALNTLQKIDPRKVRMIELRYFGGLSVEETAAAMGLSPRSVKRDWTLAKAWLSRELRRDSESPDAITEEGIDT
jgi:RNA polymerase sigma factor (TIGR02999 family)